jgi:hypothetical protein
MPSLKAFWLDAQADGQKRQRGALKVTNFILHVDEPVISTKKRAINRSFSQHPFSYTRTYINLHRGSGNTQNIPLTPWICPDQQPYYSDCTDIV